MSKYINKLRIKRLHKSRKRLSLPIFPYFRPPIPNNNLPNNNNVNILLKYAKKNNLYDLFQLIIIYFNFIKSLYIIFLINS